MGLLDLLVPERCACCGTAEAALCERCRARLSPIRPPLCARCGSPVAWPVRRCRDCAGRRLSFARARSAVAYDPVAVRLVAAWKEGGRRTLAREAAAFVVAAVPPPEADAVSFVPAVAERTLWRGHNPSAGLAAELAAAWRLPVVAAVVRRRRTARQRDLGAAERRRNVRSAFASAGHVPRAVVLVDDVYTTGSTVSAAAQALRAGGAGRVEVVTFARALRGGRGAGSLS